MIRTDQISSVHKIYTPGAQKHYTLDKCYSLHDVFDLDSGLQQLAAHKLEHTLKYVQK